MPPRLPSRAAASTATGGLAEALGDAGPRLVAALYARWDAERGAPGAAWLDLFRLAQEDATQRGILSERGAALARMVGAPVDGEDAQHGAILAAQTAVALVARLVALRVTERLAPAAPGLAALRGAPDAAVLDVLANAGRTLDDRGVIGLLEGDPFGWALEEGSDLITYHLDRANADNPESRQVTSSEVRPQSVPDALRDVIDAIVALPDALLPVAANADTAGADATRDHFAALTQALVPAPVRHALGEFYTPAWLADRVVDGALAHAGPPSGWRGLDPCCGSGAFLLALARRVLAETRDAPPAARLRAVLDRVAGVDLHPLAVLTARVNLLVACAPLLAPGEVVAVAVARGDATLAGLGAALPAAPDAAPAPPDLGRFTVVVGNPPWVDWKRLPPAQRAALRDTGVARALYSATASSVA